MTGAPPFVGIPSISLAVIRPRFVGACMNADKGVFHFSSAVKCVVISGNGRVVGLHCLTLSPTILGMTTEIRYDMLLAFPSGPLDRPPYKDVKKTDNGSTAEYSANRRLEVKTWRLPTHIFTLSSFRFRCLQRRQTGNV
ncbi:unnamed protein product [Strongylus vulgaris]|uniref:Uncharacterized protein n=1 Tax=Strongylus vulgaris TaxID=40348 RepID=A0A3P7L9U7_STRVU|nr:unnamed protein product [Strongylus vulgaris]